MRRGDMANREDHLLSTIGSSAGHMLSHNRRAILGGIAVLAVVGYASANALFFQQHKHPSAFFETRQDSRHGSFALQADERGTVTEPAEQQVTRIVFDHTASQTTQLQQTSLPAPTDMASDRAENVAATVPAAVRPVADDPISDLQTMLASLGFYDGAVDGIKGSRTQAAVDAYKTSVGLRGIDLTIDELRTSLRNNMMVTAAIPRQRPAATAGETATQTIDRTRIAEANQAPVADPAVLRVQAGLKAFGNGGIKVDGVVGPETLAAVREFQALFRLPVTGEIDPALVDKMVAVGLID